MLCGYGTVLEILNLLFVKRTIHVPGYVHIAENLQGLAGWLAGGWFPRGTEEGTAKLVGLCIEPSHMVAALCGHIADDITLAPYLVAQVDVGISERQSAPSSIDTMHKVLDGVKAFGEGVGGYTWSHEERLLGTCGASGGKELIHQFCALAGVAAGGTYIII